VPETALVTCRNTEDEPAFVLLFFNAGKFTNVDIQWFVGALALTLRGCRAVCSNV